MRKSNLLVAGLALMLCSSAGAAFKFTGKGNKISVGNHDDFNLKAGGVLSGDVMVKTTEENTPIISRWTETGQGFALIISDGRPLLRSIKSGGDKGSVQARSGRKINDGNWHHVYYSMNSNNNKKMELYVDGVKYASSYQLSYLGEGWSASLPLTVGAIERYAYLGISCNENFTGEVDNVRIFNRSFTDAEIKSLKDANIDSNHPAYSKMVLSLPLDEGNDLLKDQSKNGLKTALVADGAEVSLSAVDFNVKSCKVKRLSGLVRGGGDKTRVEVIKSSKIRYTVDGSYDYKKSGPNDMYIEVSTELLKNFSLSVSDYQLEVGGKAYKAMGIRHYKSKEYNLKNTIFSNTKSDKSAVTVLFQVPKQYGTFTLVPSLPTTITQDKIIFEIMK